MDDYNYLFKIILIGDANVGKTCLVKRFTKGFFTPSQGPTIGVDFTIRTVEVDGEKVKVHHVCFCNHLDNTAITDSCASAGYQPVSTLFGLEHFLFSAFFLINPASAPSLNFVFA